MRAPLLAILGLGVAALFAYNAVALAEETSPLVWGGAAAAGLAGILAFRFLVAHPPALIERLKGPRSLLLPATAAAVALLLVSSSSESAQLLSLALFAGFLLAAVIARLRGWGP